MSVDKDPEISLADRLAFGNLTVEETRTLKSRSHSGFYEDLKEGIVAIRKIGRKTGTLNDYTPNVPRGR